MGSTLIRKVRSFAELSVFTKLWLVPVWVSLGFSRTLIAILPFRKLAPMLGTAHGTTADVPPLTPAQEERAVAIGRTVELVARYTPWTSDCYPQAIVARMLLGIFGVPYAIHFGLIRGDDCGTGPSSARRDRGMCAHAWVVAGRVAVTGGPSFGRYTVVGVFTGDPASSAR